RPQSVAELRQALGSPGSAMPEQHSMLTRVLPVSDPFAATQRLAPGTAMEGEDLSRLSKDLAGHIGPIASMVVKSALRKALTPAQLVQAVAVEISDLAARSAFVRKHMGHAQPASGIPVAATHSRTQPSGPLTSAQRFEPAVLVRAETELARAIGAVARAVVRRAASKSHSESELFALLANEIENPIERKAFSRKMQSVSGRE
ncbi:MAG: hypothetical protein ABI343_10005, partial [Burkholderiaceae bacterium]